jgi:CHASE3 domain sensor protein
MEEFAMNKLTDFAKGIIAGFVSAVIIFGMIAGLIYFRNRDKELIQYVEQQNEIEVLREDYRNTPADEFLEIPNVRRTADSARTDFDKKRDEALQRFRSGSVD